MNEYTLRRGENGTIVIVHNGEERILSEQVAGYMWDDFDVASGFASAAVRRAAEHAAKAEAWDAMGSGRGYGRPA